MIVNSVQPGYGVPAECDHTHARVPRYRGGDSETLFYYIQYVVAGVGLGSTPKSIRGLCSERRVCFFSCVCGGSGRGHRDHRYTKAWSEPLSRCMTLTSGWTNASSKDQMTTIIRETFIVLRSSKSDFLSTSERDVSSPVSVTRTTKAQSHLNPGERQRFLNSSVSSTMMPGVYLPTVPSIPRRQPPKLQQRRWKKTKTRCRRPWIVRQRFHYLQESRS